MMTGGLRRQIVVTSVMSLVALIWLSVCEVSAETRWAVVVGIDHYESPRIPRLAGAVKDADTIARAFIQYVEVPETNLVLLTSAGADKPTKERVLGALLWLRERAQPEDLILVFFAGHGVERSGEHYLLTFDTKTGADPDAVSEAAVRSSALTATELRRELDGLKARHRIVMIDACRTDPFSTEPGPNVAPQSYEATFALSNIPGPGVRATYLSTSSGLSAYEWPAVGQGFFSYYIEQGLSGLAVGYGGDVTPHSLSQYLNRTVRRQVDSAIGKEQIPIGAVVGGDFTLVRQARVAPGTAMSLNTVAVTRSIWGVVRDSQKMSLSDVSVRVRLRAVASRGPVLVGTAPTEIEAYQFATRTDEDGHFKIDSLPSDAALEIRVDREGYESRILTPDPLELKDKFQVSLARSRETLSRLPAERPGSSTAVLAAARGLTLIEARALREYAAVALDSFLAEEFDAAEQSARAALAIDANDALAHAVLGNALVATVTSNERFPRDRRQQVLTEARQHIDRALALEPTVALGHNARGLLWYAQNDLRRAREEFVAATRLDAALGVAYANLGNLDVRQRRYADAERAFRAAIALRPENAIPYHGLANALRRQGKSVEAVNAARDAIARYTRRDIVLAEFHVTLAGAHYEALQQEEALEAVAVAKALGLPRHDAYSVIESGRPPRRQ